MQGAKYAYLYIAVLIFLIETYRRSYNINGNGLPKKIIKDGPLILNMQLILFTVFAKFAGFLILQSDYKFEIKIGML